MPRPSHSRARSPNAARPLSTRPEPTSTVESASSVADTRGRGLAPGLTGARAPLRSSYRASRQTSATPRSLTVERAAGSAKIALANATIETAAPEFIGARNLMDRFHAMMRPRDAARLDPWIASAEERKVASFAAGVEADKDAIAAAITGPWA
jgi:transposase